MKRRYAFRLPPTPAHTRALARVFGACRLVYHWGLRLRTDACRQEDYTLSYPETSALLTRLKRTPEHAWLQELSSIWNRQALRHLPMAFVNLFKKSSQYPSFRKKTGDPSAQYPRSASTGGANHPESLHEYS